MIELLHDLSDWVVRFAESDWAVAALALLSFSESIFFPIPPDLLLIGIAIVQPHLGIWLGALTALSSVAGALVGHWLGKRFGRPLLHRFFPEDKVDLVEGMFRRYGVAATLMAAFTPLPYKVFAITAGALDLDRRTFLIASLVGRGLRFILLGALIFFFGETIQSFISDYFGALTVAAAVVIIAGMAAWGVLYRRRRARGAVR